VGLVFITVEILATVDAREDGAVPAAELVVFLHLQQQGAACVGRTPASIRGGGLPALSLSTLFFFRLSPHALQVNVTIPAGVSA
jgi:hypothetical protein